MSNDFTNKKKLPHTYKDILKTIDDFFSKSFQHLHENSMFAPIIPVRTFEDEEAYYIEAELPGISKKQIQLDVLPQYIRIAVQHHETIEIHDEAKKTYSRTHALEGRERIVPLPFPVKENEIKAKFQNGLLTIVIPNRRKTISIEP
ncbi:Hsp20/alpha crystallin family protein [Halalkalibacterium ligniniphilum]|uniref:Hsp20/alpha crystallin family protein n=1 Tax=Halalkalibacterium ligniniphilum TaxID=1134413 RepID=UPI00034D1C22|nr:Hsp20/alpha crystallin family protein [Halalkalibacterium ligniniphilum]